MALKKPTDGGPRDAADAAQHRGGEGFDAGDETHEEVHLAEDHRIQHTSDAGHCGPGGEGDRDSAVDVDAHQSGHVFIFSYRPDCFSGLGLHDKEVQPDQHGDGCNYYQRVWVQ